MSFEKHGLYKNNERPKEETLSFQDKCAYISLVFIGIGFAFMCIPFHCICAFMQI
jgi:hypothetical protein